MLKANEEEPLKPYKAGESFVITLFFPIRASSAPLFNLTAKDSERLTASTNETDNRP